MSQSAHTPFPEDELETRELAFVGAERTDEPEAEPARRRRPPLPTLHLAAHELVRFAPPAEPEVDPD